MRISDRKKWIAGAVVAGILAGAGVVAGAGTFAFALDPDARIIDNTPPAVAYEQALRAYQAGHEAEALKALEFAAGKGYAKAQWELARRYADGDGVERNSLKAFKYFQILANDHAEDNPFLSTARIIADSFVELSGYYLSGIPEAGVVQDISVAFNLLYHAATYFGDPEAQYQLGKMYLEGKGREPNLVRAAKWLNLAAKKNHVGAQAELGRLLYLRRDAPHDKLAGLMYLELAKRRADPATQGWVIRSHDQIFAGLDGDQQGMAVAAADAWAARHGQQR